MELQENLKESWPGIFQKCLNDLKNKYPSFSESQLADKIDVNRSTLNRIKNEGKLPTLDNLIKIVLGSGNSEMLTDAIKIFDSSLGNKLSDILSVSLKEDNKIPVDSELERILNDRDVFVVYLLASLKEGTTLNQIKTVLGSKGEQALSTLKKHNLIENTKEQNLRVIKNGILVRSFESVKHHLSTYAAFYKPSHVGRKRNYAYSLSDGLNLDGLRKMQEIQKQCHEAMREVFRDEKYKGDIPSFSVGFCDTFTADDSLSVEPKGRLQ